jgi:hypothetical protein
MLAKDGLPPTEQDALTLSRRFIMARPRHSILVAIAVLVRLFGPSPVHAVTVDFSGVNSASVSSPSGQDFTYVVGSGPSTGILNVHFLSGSIGDLTTGSGPDANGFYMLQSGPQTPALFRFTFDQPRDFLITSNETLTVLETNTFSLPVGGGAWSVLSASNAGVSGSGPQVSFVGLVPNGPFGQFALRAAAISFDFLISNAPGFPTYGSAISVEVLDHTTPTKATSWGRVKSLYR